MGAALFKDSDRVAACVDAMCRSGLPVSVKCRTGVDDVDDFAYLVNFVRRVRDAGATMVQVHARKAWLKGLNPRQNRSVPPLNYDRVVDLSAALPGFPIVLNGGLRTVEDCLHQLSAFPGVMIGRKVCEDPWFLHELAVQLEGNTVKMNQRAVLESYLSYAWQQIEVGQSPSLVFRPLLAMLKGKPNAKKCRQELSLWCCKSTHISRMGFECLQETLLDFMV